MTAHEEQIARFGDEACRLHATLFGVPAPTIIQQRFAAASEQMDRGISPDDLAWYHRALDRIGDLEALEVATRYLRRRDLLFRKFRLMTYLAETQPEYQRFFINERSSFIAGFFRCALSTFRTGWKLCKGAWLLRTMDHA